MKTLKIIASICIPLAFSLNVNAQCTNCENTLDNGVNSSAIGKGTEATGQASFASGAYSIASGDGATSIGFRNLSSDIYTTTIGNFLQATESHAMVIGDGYGLDNELINNNAYSLMIGFNSTKPTLFISTSDGNLKTGKIGIGNITNPIAKLHLKSDDGEFASIFIEPNNWNAGEPAKLLLGDTNHFIKAENIYGVEFSSTNNFVFTGNNSGFGVEEPKAKVHINGDLLFEQNMNGIIMKSEDGNCWKGTITNSGELEFSQIDCGTLTSVQNNIQEKHSEVFIYPNPTNGELTIEYTGNKKNLRVEFYTINGLLLETHKIRKGENSIELSKIPGQMIIASIFTTKGELISTNKILIN